MEKRLALIGVTQSEVALVYLPEIPRFQSFVAAGKCRLSRFLFPNGLCINLAASLTSHCDPKASECCDENRLSDRRSLKSSNKQQWSRSSFVQSCRWSGVKGAFNNLSAAPKATDSVQLRLEGKGAVENGLGDGGSHLSGDNWVFGISRA
jgi:hypothetical protein